MLHKNAEIELHIESLALDGKGVARLRPEDIHDTPVLRNGMVCFVRNGVPGDVVRARVARVKRNYAEAEVAAVLSPSPNRVEPKCRHFGTCGGCRWQHVAYELQLQEKHQYVVDAFERIGGFRNLSILPIIGAGNIYFYRNKIEFSFSEKEWSIERPTQFPPALENTTGQTGAASALYLGFHVPGRYDKVVDVHECWLPVRQRTEDANGGSELSNGILNTVREFCKERRLTVYSTKTHDGYLRHLVVRQSHRTSQTMVNLVTTTDKPEIMRALTKLLLERHPATTTVVNNITSRKSMVAVGDAERIYHGPGFITERLGNHTFRVSANSFFQTNTDQAERLYAIAKEFAELMSDDVVFDLYCGTGTIALFLSDAVREVVGIDVAESAIKDASLNAELNGVRNCRFIIGDLNEKLTKETSWLTTRPDVVVVDPPRSGLHPKVIKEVAELGPERVVYVSCNPATQARDAKMLCALGYVLTKLQPLDMFPHTSHVENVAAFRKNPNLVRQAGARSELSDSSLRSE